MDPAELLQKCQDGDELAWEVLVRQHQGRICSIAYGYVGEHDEAMDLALDGSGNVYVTGVFEQTVDFANLPPAIILDVDETVLDNSPARALGILRGQPGSDPAAWKRRRWPFSPSSLTIRTSRICTGEYGRVGCFAGSTPAPPRFSRCSGAVWPPSSANPLLAWSA